MTKHDNKNDEQDLEYIDLTDSSNVFSTYDIGLSAAFLCIGFKLLSVDKQNPRKALFIFRKEAGMKDFSEQYFSDTLGVRARAFFDHLKALKNMLYSR